VESADSTDFSTSPFAEAWAEPDRDEENMLLHRGTNAFVILNKYPYNPGHLLIVPVRQVQRLADLESDELHEMMDMIAFGSAVVERALQPGGCNVGMNLGRGAGAAIDTHLHAHVVPRWDGDTNFMPILADTKVISQSMEDTFRKLIAARDQLLAERSD
jgi:ATP adenylyltransferase